MVTRQPSASTHPDWIVQASSPARRPVDTAWSDLRLLTSHVQSDQPSDALAHRLVALARARDPDLAETVRRELAGTRRLSPADIDRILTRIEDVP